MPYQRKKRKIRKHRIPDRAFMALRKRERKKIERMEWKAIHGPFKSMFKRKLIQHRNVR